MSIIACNAFQIIFNIKYAFFAKIIIIKIIKMLFIQEKNTQFVNSLNQKASNNQLIITIKKLYDLL